MFVEYTQTHDRTFTLTSNADTAALDVAAVLTDHQSGKVLPLLVTPSSISVSANTTASFTVSYDCSQTNGTHAIVKVSIDSQPDFEYVKQCHNVPNPSLTYFVSAVSLLTIATATLAVGVRLDRLELLNDVRDADMYEIDSVTVWQVLGLVCVASSALFAMYVLITWLSLSWLVTIVFTIS